MDLLEKERSFMARALELAALSKPYAGANPAVGAVIVRAGRIIGEGYYRGHGTLHAEAEALEMAGPHARGADMFVTLEPHCYQGTQPPCTERIIAAGIRRVVVSAIDPNPRVHGQGIAQLRSAGVEVEVGPGEEEARRLNRGFFKCHEKGAACFRLKLALSLDGFIADANGRSRWISGPEAKQEVHRMRSETTAIAVGVGTVLADDPLLTPREVYCPRKPARFVLDRKLRIPAGARVLNQDAPTVVVTTPDAPSEKMAEIQGLGHEVWVMDGGIDLGALARRMAESDYNDVLFEGGAGVARSLLESDCLDELILIYSPCYLGKGLSPFGGPFSLDKAPGFALEEVVRMGNDVLMRLYPRRSQA